VRAGISGVLVALPTPVQVGQHVTVGTSVAKWCSWTVEGQPEDR
jgi:hypothetical protein